MAQEQTSSNLFRVYGMNHFSVKYGLPLSSSLEEFSRSFSVDLVESEIRDNIVDWVETDYGVVPFFEEIQEDSLIEQTRGGVKVSFDVFGAVGRILSGHLEGLAPEEKRKIASVPVVDIYEQILFDALSGSNGELRAKPFWPENKKFAVCLTHDVDEVRKTYQYFTRPIRHLMRLEFMRALYHIKSFFSDKFSGGNPYWTFDDLMSIERDLGVRSTFFFLQEDGKPQLGSPGSWSVYGRRYRFSNPRVVEVLHRLSEGGWEVGLHGSFYSYLDLGKLRRDKRELEGVLGQGIHGIRQHHLNLKIPETWRFHEEVGLDYDTTLGFKNDIGFRWGTCFPFHPFDPDTREPLSILELPLIIMDTPLFTSKKNVWDRILKLVETVEGQGGVITVLFHHSVFNEREYPGWTENYQKLINLCREKNAWITNAYEINKWWRSR